MCESEKISIHWPEPLARLEVRTQLPLSTQIAHPNPSDAGSGFAQVSRRRFRCEMKQEKNVEICAKLSATQATYALRHSNQMDAPSRHGESLGSSSCDAVSLSFLPI